MIQLYIDGKPAVIKSGTSFKFYRENIYFTDAEDYTLDVTLPLQGCPENLAIFSAIHRPEMSAVHLIGKKYPFHFIAPPLDITGSAIVTEINEMEVKVQLLAGSSVLNFDKTDEFGNDIYIDELDLGAAYDITYPGVKYDGVGRGSLWSKIAGNEALLHSSYDNSIDKCVCFPVYSEASDTVVNVHVYDNISRPSYELGRSFEYFAAQPYLLLVIERVFKAIGYTLSPNNAIAQSWQRNLFIANARNEYLYNRILPHWTVSEFLKEVSIFCGVIFVTEGNIVNAVRKADYYADNTRTVLLSEVIDEFITEISDEEEGSNDPRTGNVGYDFTSIDPMLQLPDEVWEKAILVEIDKDSQIVQWASGKDVTMSLWLFADTSKDAGRTFAYIQEGDSWFPCEVDQAGPIIRNDKRNRNIDVSLRIVPSMMTWQPVDYIYTTSQGRRGTEYKAFMLPMLKMDAAIDKAIDTYNVNDAINPNREDASCDYIKPERIEVALFDGSSKSMSTYTDPAGEEVDIIIPLATGIPYAREEGRVSFQTLFTDTNTHELLLLKQDVPDGMFQILTSGKEIDTRCRHCFQFLDNIEANTQYVFLIKGRKYACEKIEYSVEETGMSPIKRGYFYELND